MAPENAPVRVIKKLAELIEETRTKKELCEGLQVLEDQIYRDLTEAVEGKKPIEIRDLANELEFIARSKMELCRR